MGVRGLTHKVGQPVARRSTQKEKHIKPSSRRRKKWGGGGGGETWGLTHKVGQPVGRRSTQKQKHTKPSSWKTKLGGGGGGGGGGGDRDWHTKLDSLWQEGPLTNIKAHWTKQQRNKTRGGEKDTHTKLDSLWQDQSAKASCHKRTGWPWKKFDFRHKNWDWKWRQEESMPFLSLPNSYKNVFVAWVQFCPPLSDPVTDEILGGCSCSYSSAWAALPLRSYWYQNWNTTKLLNQ